MSDSLDPTTLIFAGGGGRSATGLLFGLFPALHSTRPDLVTAIKSTAGQPSGARAASRFRTAPGDHADRALDDAADPGRASSPRA